MGVVVDEYWHLPGSEQPRGGGANKAASCPPKPPPRLIMHPVSLPGILNPDVGPRETCSRQRPAGTTAIHEGPMPQAKRPNVDLLLDQRRKVKSWFLATRSHQTQNMCITFIQCWTNAMKCCEIRRWWVSFYDIIVYFLSIAYVYRLKGCVCQLSYT